MAGIKMRFKKYGAWDKFKMIMKGAKFDKLLHENVRRANTYLCLYIVKQIRREIQGGGYEKNAELTTLLKGSTKPLVGPGDAELFKAITKEIVNDFSAFVGVLRSEKSASGEDLVNIAEVVHEGSTITVTEAMRGMFIAMAAASRGDMPESKLEGRALELYNQLKGRGEIYPLKADTTAITIPARPFVRKVFEDPEVMKRVQDTWAHAMKASFQGEKVSFQSAPSKGK